MAGEKEETVLVVQAAKAPLPAIVRVVGAMATPGVLALRKREGAAAVHSLVLPAAEYQPARRLRLQTARSSTPIRLGRLLEQQPDWVWTALEVLDPTTSLHDLAPVTRA